MQNTARLAAKVRAQNKVNAFMRACAPLYFAAITPFVGEKIYKADGDFTKKFKQALPPGIPGDFFNPSNYSLSRVFRVSEPVAGESGCEYMESTVYFGELEGGNLKSVLEFHPERFRTDYTVEEILVAREELKTAQRAVSVAQGKLAAFGEYDR